jgi:hypothetical protein
LNLFFATAAAVSSSSTENDDEVTNGRDLWEATKPQADLNSLLEVDDTEQAEWSASYSRSSYTRSPTRATTRAPTRTTSATTSAGEWGREGYCKTDCVSGANCCERGHSATGRNCANFPSKCCNAFQQPWYSRNLKRTYYGGCFGWRKGTPYGDGGVGEWRKCIDESCCRQCGITEELGLLQADNNSTEDVSNKIEKQEGEDSLLALLGTEQNQEQRHSEKVAGWNCA